jgi:Uma2 family endonuclease
VVSPREDALDKAIDYLEAGTLAVWAIYGEKRSVCVMHLDTEGKLVVETLTEDDTLSGGDIIPGFTVRVRDIFPQYGA